MDRYENVWLLMDSLNNWSTNMVQFWLENIGNGKFIQYGMKISDLNIDGNALINLNRDDLKNDFGIKDALIIRLILREIEILMKQTNIPKPRKSKIVNSKHTRTASQIQRDKQMRTQSRKLGPRDIGTNKGYKGSKYDDSKDAAFLADKVNPQAKTENFVKRKQKVGPIHKQSAQEIGMYVIYLMVYYIEYELY